MRKELLNQQSLILKWQNLYKKLPSKISKCTIVIICVFLSVDCDAAGFNLYFNQKLNKRGFLAMFIDVHQCPFHQFQQENGKLSITPLLPYYNTPRLHLSEQNLCYQVPTIFLGFMLGKIQNS